MNKASLSSIDATNFGPVSLPLYAALNHSLDTLRLNKRSPHAPRHMYFSDGFVQSENLPHQNKALLHAIARRFDPDEFQTQVLSREDVTTEKFGGTISNVVRLLSDVIASNQRHLRSILVFVDLTEMNGDLDPETLIPQWGEFEQGLSVMLCQYPNLGLFGLATKKQLNEHLLNLFLQTARVAQVEVNT